MERTSSSARAATPAATGRPPVAAGGRPSTHIVAPRRAPPRPAAPLAASRSYIAVREEVLGHAEIAKVEPRLVKDRAEIVLLHGRLGAICETFSHLLAPSGAMDAARQTASRCCRRHRRTCAARVAARGIGKTGSMPQAAIDIAHCALRRPAHLAISGLRNRSTLLCAGLSASGRTAGGNGGSGRPAAVGRRAQIGRGDKRRGARRESLAKVAAHSVQLTHAHLEVLGHL